MGDFDWSRYEELSERWTRLTRAYCEGINRFVEVGLRDGWEAAGPEPEDERDEALGDEVVAVVREANEAGAWEGLRARFPPAHRPFIPWLQRAAIGWHGVVWIDDTRLFAFVGAPWQGPAGMLLTTSGDYEMVPELEAVARSPDRRFFARAYPDRAEITAGWDGEVVLRCRRPTGNEGLPAGWPSDDDGYYLVELQVMPEGDGVVWVTSAGVFFADDERVTRLFPHADPDIEDDDDKHLHTDMIHAAVSPRGDLIATGTQDSAHALVAPDGEIVAEAGPFGSEYPHHAFFLDDGRVVGFNSCHFYNGVTTALPVSEFMKLDDDAWEPDAGVILHGGARVYASVEHAGAILLGDAHGYVRAMEPDGRLRWQHFVGSTIGGLDTSPDGGRLAVGTAAGFLSLITLETGETPSVHIGSATHREDLRFVRWEGERLWRW